MILYKDENENNLIDFHTLMEVLNMKKSTLHKLINDLYPLKPLKYKNQYLYKEEILFIIMRDKLINRLNEF
jgi:hypothetical protein